MAGCTTCGSNVGEGGVCPNCGGNDGLLGNKRPGCFPAGTYITTPTGSKDISKLRKGNNVISHNQRDGLLKPRKILDVKFYTERIIWLIDFDDGSQLKTTASHSLYSNNQWVKASSVRAGDSLTCFDPVKGKIIKKVMCSENSQQNEVVYNLIVEKDFNFIANGTLAHSFSYLRLLRVALWTLKSILRIKEKPKYVIA